MEFQIIFFVFVSLNFIFSKAQKNPNFSSGRSVIVHLNEWKWIDIAQECERYFQDKTYGGIQVFKQNLNFQTNLI